MEVFDNVSRIVRDDLVETIKPHSRLCPARAATPLESDSSSLQLQAVSSSTLTSPRSNCAWARSTAEMKR